MHLLRTALFLLGFSFSSLQAADIPTTVEGAERFDKEICISQAVNDCIESVCTTSSDIDCNSQCQTDAEDKCQEQAEE